MWIVILFWAGLPKKYQVTKPLANCQVGLLGIVFFSGGETIPNKRIPSLVDGKNLSLAHSNLTLPVNVTADCGFALFASLSHLLRDFSVETIGPST